MSSAAAVRAFSDGRAKVVSQKRMRLICECC